MIDRNALESGVDKVPLERVELEITTLSGQIAAASARLLLWIAEYDRRRGWVDWGCQSAAHWLSWRCGDALHTAREKVRVAKALGALPIIRDAFEAGKLSYSKVRAVTRVAVSDDDDDEWARIARNSTGAMLERIVVGVRRSLEDEDDAAGDAFGQRPVTRIRRDSGVDEIRMRLPTDMAETVWAAIEGAASRQVDESAAQDETNRREVIAEHGGVAAMRADAMVEIAERIVAAAPISARRGRRRSGGDRRGPWLRRRSQHPGSKCAPAPGAASTRSWDVSLPWLWGHLVASCPSCAALGRRWPH